MRHVRGLPGPILQMDTDLKSGPTCSQTGSGCRAQRQGGLSTRVKDLLVREAPGPALAWNWLPCVTEGWRKGPRILESASLELGAFPWSPTWDHQWMGLASMARAERLKREGRLCSWSLFFSLEFTLGGLLVPLSSCSDTQAPPPRLPARTPLPRLLSEHLQGHCSVLGQLFPTSSVSPFYLLIWPCVSPEPLTALHTHDSFCVLVPFFNQKIGGENGFLLALPPWLLRALVPWESCGCCSVAKPRLILCNPTDCRPPGFSVLPYLPEFVRANFHLVYR